MITLLKYYKNFPIIVKYINFLTTPQNFHVNTRKVIYCNVYKELYAGKSYSRIFAKSEELLFDKDVVNFPFEEIATRLSGSLLLKYKNFKGPCPLTLRDAFLNSNPSDFYLGHY
jgi:hypothetical protein